VLKQGEVEQIIVTEKSEKLPHHLLVKGSLEVLKEMWENANGTKR